MSEPAFDVDSTRAANRRKACDLCFTKKIKCDMLKPICSNCILYHADCKTSIIRRRPNPPKPRAAPAAPATQSEPTDGKTETVEERLARIEKQLEQVLAQTRANHLGADSSSTSGESGELTLSEVVQKDGTLKSWRFDPVGPTLYSGPATDGMPLPPWEELQPIVDHYFNTVNGTLPLFDQQTFMRYLQGWYENPCTRDVSTWAAIQMVTAVGLRTPVPGEDPKEKFFEKIQWADCCLRNAQSVVSELVTREDDLMGVQVLLALVSMFQNSSDPRPAAVLIATAIRLAHRMQLHSKAAMQNYSPDEQKQRSRVFWIAYALDKDISLRGRTPSIQSDADVDVPLPPMMPEDGAGIIWTKDGRSHFNHFRMRVDLAHIEGKIYDNLCSNRAMKISAAERRSRSAVIHDELVDWYSRVPEVFRVEHVRSTVGEIELICMVKLHHAYLLAQIATHGTWSRDGEWVRRVSSANRAAILDFALGIGSQTSKECLQTKESHGRDGWKACVELSRACMKLFQEATPTECLIWQCSCAYFSALIIILANIILHPSHNCVALDQHLATNAMTLMDRFIEVVTGKLFHTLQKVIADLNTTADRAVKAVQNKEKAQQPPQPSNVEDFLGETMDPVTGTDVFGQDLVLADFPDHNGTDFLGGYTGPLPQGLDAFLGDDSGSNSWAQMESSVSDFGHVS